MVDNSSHSMRKAGSRSISNRRLVEKRGSNVYWERYGVLGR
jgi:hypothetical protein